MFRRNPELLAPTIGIITSPLQEGVLTVDRPSIRVIDINSLAKAISDRISAVYLNAPDAVTIRRLGSQRFSTVFSKEKVSVYRSRRGGSGRSRRLREQQQCQLCSGREGNQCAHTASPILFSKPKLN